MVVLAGASSLATGRDCELHVENDGSASLGAAEPLVVERYRIFAPRGSVVKADVSLRSDEAATVRVALVPDDPTLWDEPVSGTAETVVAVAAGSSGKAKVELPECRKRACVEHAVALELELVEGSQAAAEWTAHAEINECDAERTDDDLYFEIRRD